MMNSLLHFSGGGEGRKRCIDARVALKHMLTPDIVNHIIAAFKDHKDQLLKEAQTNDNGDFAQATFQHEGWLVTAHLNVEDGIWFRLDASPENVPDDEPSVVMLISPPEEETWR